MPRATKFAGLVIGWMFLSNSAYAGVAPTVSQMLPYKPKQAGVNYTTPTDAEQAACKVELVNLGKNVGSGWILRDGKGQILRRFFATTGHRNPDVWSYYLDGVEVYREFETAAEGQAATAVVHHYRWLNAGGMKWGIDLDGDGRIDAWKAISAEEVSQEILQALIAKDFARLQALWITDAEIESLEFPAAEAARLRELKQQGQAKFQSALAKLSALSPQTRWERLECTAPQSMPAEQIGMKRDLIKYVKSSILYENNGKHDWIQTGELVQVGSAWRIVDAPAPGDGSGAGGTTGPSNPALQALLDKLQQIDALAPKPSETPTANAALAKYNIDRADVLEQIIGKVKVEDNDTWIRQLADSLSTAAQSSAKDDKTAYDRLVRLEQQAVKDHPGSSLAGYVTFREMSAEYAPKLATAGPEFSKVQEAWIARLTKFVQEYPRTDDSPDALLQLGMVSEFLGKDIEAKKWYQQLASNFPDKKGIADKAQGALRRLDLEGKNFELAGTTGDQKPFNVAQLQGNVVIVYYWAASWNEQSVGDFARLTNLMKTYAARGVRLVCVNLDTQAPLPGAVDPTIIPGTVQIVQPGGLESPLATQYGFTLLPHMFLVAKDGTVASRNMQLANLEEEIKKLLK